MTQLGEAFVPIRATLDKLDGDLAGAKSKISDALEGLGKVGGAALAGALAVGTAAFSALSGAMIFSVGQALEAEKGQSQLALSVGLANDAIAEQGAAFEAASGQTVSSTLLSADALAELQDNLEHATAKLHDMEAAYPKLKNPTESQTLALQDQRDAVAQLTAEIETGSAVITTSLVDALNLVPPSAQFTIEALNDLAQQFAPLAQGSDDVITAIETIALRAGSVSMEEMPAFIQTVLDLGTSMGDTSAAATLLARAQEDPLAAMARLQKGGIVFTQTLEDQIKALVKQGDTAGATALVLDRVADATGGAAAAAAATLSGRWETLKGMMSEAAETVGTSLLPFLSDLFNNVLAPAIPIITNISDLIGQFFDRLGSGFTVAQALPALFQEIGLELGLTQEQAFQLGEKVGGVITWFTDLIAKVQEVITVVTPYLETAAAWLASTVSLQDILIALGAAIAAFVIPAIISVVSAAAPIVLLFVGIIAVAALLRTAWEENWGGIQEKMAAVWAQIEPVFTLLKQWLEVNIPLAMEALRAWWVDTVMPAITAALEAAWPVIQALFAAWVNYVTNFLIPMITFLWDTWVNVVWPAIMSALASAWAFIQPILAAIGEFIVGTLIPTIVDLWTKWTTVWWPEIQNTLENVWEVISEVFAELGRWINDNIVPWVVFLGEQWAEIFAAIQTKLTEVWAVLLPIWQDLQLWLETNIPKALNALQPIFESVMAGISAAVGPVKTMWDGLVKAVGDFWTWITSHTFNFSISIPDLPDWAVPGSPLPIHTAWKAFAEDMDRMTISPKVDMGALLPVAALVEDGGADRSVRIDSHTVVNTSADPLRVLRAARHLDKLGALA